MTNMSVKGIGLITYVGQKGPPVAENAGKTDGFGDFMGQIAKRSAQQANTAPGLLNKASEAKTINTPNHANANETAASRMRSERSNGTNAPAQTGNTAAVSEKVSAAAQKIVAAVSEETGIPAEDIMAALAALGLSPESLLDLANLRDLLASLLATDPLLLVTDEGLYNSLTDLTGGAQAIIDGLLKELGLTPEELAELLKQMEASAKNADSGTELTGQAGKANEAAQQAAGEQRITIVVEKDGQIIDMTARADERGTVKNVVETLVTEAKAQVFGEGQKASTQQQDLGQNSQQKEDGYAALLNSLLQSKVAAVQPQLEPLFMPQAPDTAMIMKQIMDYMKLQLGPEVNRLEMQLHPAHLGTVGVKISSQAGVITAQFIAQNEVVKAAIESQIVELRDNMRSQGIKVESVEVNVETKDFNSALKQEQGEENKEEKQQKGRRRINLSGIELDELAEDLSEEEKLNAEMMVANGQTVDFTA